MYPSGTIPTLYLVISYFIIDAVWYREENRKFRENREHILALMEHLNIIAKPVLYTDDDATQYHV